MTDPTLPQPPEQSGGPAIEDEGPEAVVAGHICLDVIPTLTGSAIDFVPGKLVEAGGVTTATGGVVSNTGLALHRLGVRTGLIGKVGDDLFGDAVLKILSGVDARLVEGMVVSPSEATSYSIILSPPGADRMFIHAPGCNATFDEHDIPAGSLDSPRLFHFGYPPLMARTYRNGGASLEAIFRNAKAAGITTSLDMSMPDMAGPAGRVDWRALLQRVLPFVDIFLPSLDELRIMLPGACEDSLGARLPRCLAAEVLDMGGKAVVIKAGHRGLYLRTAPGSVLAKMGRAAPDDLGPWSERELWAPCFSVGVVGTTGSGDATIAGFLMGLLRGMTPERAMTAACAVGACSVEAADAAGGIRAWPETAARIDAGWPRLPVDLDLDGWRRDDRNAVWRGPADRAAQL